MQIAKWGNSLAVRIPADVAREFGLNEGDEVSLAMVGDAQVAIITDTQWRRVIAEGFRKFRGLMPPDYKFDREALHDRDSK